MSNTIQILPMKPKLAPTPTAEPKYAVQVQVASGTKEKFSDPKAVRAMLALMDMQAVLGGAASHWGGPSAFAELMSAVHGVMFTESLRLKTPWYELFNFVNDAGHCENGLYALKANYGFADLNLESLKGFRSIHSPLTGHGESHLFPEGVQLSNGPLGSALPQAQGLAYADQLIEKERATVVAISDGACMEGEVREAMAIIPGLAGKGKLAPFVLIISDNNTKLTGRMDDSYPMRPTFDSLKSLGWDVLHLEDAHDIQSCVDFFEQALSRARKNPSRPIAIHAKTIKGYGIKKTAESATGGHGFPLKSAKELGDFLKEIYLNEEIPQEFLNWKDELVQLEEEKKSKASKDAPKIKRQKVQVGVSQALKKAKENGLPVFSVSADLPGSTGLGDFQKTYPDHVQDVGVMESNMVSMAAGLSKQGFIPVVDTFAQFGVTKGALPLIMASLSEAPMIGVFSHVGFQDAADGASHQSLMYLGMTSGIPNVRVCTLSCSDEAESLVLEAINEFAEFRKAGKTPLTTLFFLGREDFPQNFSEFGKSDFDYKLNSIIEMRDTSARLKPQVAIAASGTLVWEALKASEELEGKGIGSIVIHPASANRLDDGALMSVLERTQGKIVTVEDHQLIGGMGSLLIHQATQLISKQNTSWSLKVRSLGVKGLFGQSAYQASELYKKHELDSESIIKAALDLQ